LWIFVRTDFAPSAQFEADHGTLEASLSVQQRRREALGERPTDAVRLPLLKYRHVGIWPTGNPAQRRRFEEVLGERPALAEPAAAQSGGSHAPCNRPTAMYPCTVC
jgi:hypothetical protein